MFSNILVVCTGNICRSPYAEALIKKRAPGISVESAGLAAMVDHEADATGMRVASDRDVDLSQHRGSRSRVL